jgi:glycosyltransferase involved in cell wall biosynthesis
MNICLLGYRSNPFSGGQGVYLYYLSRALVEAGHQVDVISGPPYPELDPRVSLIQLPSLDLYAEGEDVRRFRLRYLRSVTDAVEYFSTISGGFPEPYTFGRRVQRYFQSNPNTYDVIHDNQCLAWGTLGLQRMGLPVVTTIHHPITRDLDIALAAADTFGLRLLIKRWHSFLRMQKQVIRQLAHKVTVSHAARADIESAFGLPSQSLHVIHNGIDLDRFKPASLEVGTKKDRPNPTIMTTASADSPLKGLDTLLRAFALVLHDEPLVRLILIGALKPDGDSRKLIEHLKIGHAIDEKGRVTAEEMVSLYQSATLAVVPSVYEGFGFPAGEAMACGVPLVSTSGGALPEVVGDAGITVPVQDPGAMAAAITALLKDSERRHSLGQAGLARVTKEFSWSRAAAQYLDLYHQVIEQTPCR